MNGPWEPGFASVVTLGYAFAAALPGLSLWPSSEEQDRH